MSKIIQNNKAIQQKFSNIWADTKSKFENGELKITEFHDGKLVNIEYILALIVLLDAQGLPITRNVIDIQERLREIDSNHYIYPTSSLHFTIAGCTQFHKEQKEISDERIEHIRGICERVINSWKTPLRLHIKGLNALSNGVFLQIFPQDEAFSEFRKQIIHELKLAGEDPIEQLDTGQVHMNVMRFGQSDPDQIVELINTIETLRNVEVGELVVHNVELDLTDRVQSPFTTQIVQRFSIG